MKILGHRSLLSSWPAMKEAATTSMIYVCCNLRSKARAQGAENDNSEVVTINKPFLLLVVLSCL